MNSKTRTLIREIQSKLKSPITGLKEFSSDDAVIDYAIELVHQQFKKKRLL
jgi:hypothetical protein